jgi:hypothetical protein
MLALTVISFKRLYHLLLSRLTENSELAPVPCDFGGGQWEELAMTTSLANVIGVGGVVMIALGLWGLYILMVGELRLRDHILTIQTIAVGLGLIGLAQALRLLLALVALQPGH